MIEPRVPKRRHLAAWGMKRQAGYVRVYTEPVDGVELVRVWWREIGAARPTVKSYPCTKEGKAEARAYAQGVHNRLVAPVASRAMAPIGIGALYDRYESAKSVDWRAKTQTGERARFRSLLVFAGSHTLAHTVTAEHLDRLKAELLKKGRSVNQVRATLATIRRVYRWAISRDLVPAMKVAAYAITFSKRHQAQKPVMEEFRAAARLAIIAQLDPRDPKQWRAHVLTTFLAYCGGRATASLFLELDDVELDPPVFTVDASGRTTAAFSGRVRWQADLAKTGKAWTQPLPNDAAEAMWVAIGWRHADRYSGRYVFYGAQRRTRGQALRHDRDRARNRESLDGIVVAEKPYTYSAFLRMHHEAETRAGLTPVKYRGVHAHRRGVAGDVYDATEDMHAAAESIGDESDRTVAKHYILARQDRHERLAHTISRAMEHAKDRLAEVPTTVAKDRTATETPRPRTSVRGRED